MTAIVIVLILFASLSLGVYLYLSNGPKVISSERHGPPSHAGSRTFDVNIGWEEFLVVMDTLLAADGATRWRSSEGEQFGGYAGPQFESWKFWHWTPGFALWFQHTDGRITASWTESRSYLIGKGEMLAKGFAMPLAEGSLSMSGGDRKPPISPGDERRGR